MKLNLDKILAAFGNRRAMERTHVDNHTEDIINSITDDAFAISEKNVLYASTKELGGYHYVITIIVGAFKIKTMKGAKLNIEGTDFKLDLKSDMDEFQSDHSNVSNRFITRIDFQIEKEDVEKFDKARINALRLTAKKHEIIFNTPLNAIKKD
ncbi:hypothetical protein [Hwangdonia seohaensis]|uniref:Uncharacterized protein n=1 Tax=Hwangdonia seohaensis TaxID=1240727 RepID=A0ABW3RDT4_9FLAO|nr:hypothetical protein [Hwangdonia seohaensis]